LFSSEEGSSYEGMLESDPDEHKETLTNLTQFCLFDLKSLDL
jgi:hypothetical protein